MTSGTDRRRARGSMCGETISPTGREYVEAFSCSDENSEPRYDKVNRMSSTCLRCDCEYPSCARARWWKWQRVGDVERGLARPKAEESLGCMARAIDIVPALAGAQVIRTWSGMDGQMPDHIPVMGFSSTTPHLVQAFGFSGHGFQLGPMIGLVIAELIAEGQTVSPIAPFAISRFADRRRT